jgi:DNA-directed RNA polymerase subunit H (RpoH/RPB5)
LLSTSQYNSRSNHIDRKIKHRVAIIHDILDDKEAQKLSDLLASTEQQLDKFRQQDQKRDVLWLEKDKLGKLVGTN